MKEVEDEVDVVVLEGMGKGIVGREGGVGFVGYGVRGIGDGEKGKEIIGEVKGIERGVVDVGVS